MKNVALDIEFMKRDRRLSVALEHDTRFKFTNAARRHLREAKRIERRNERHEGVRVIKDAIQDGIVTTPQNPKRQIVKGIRSAHWTGTSLIIMRGVL